MHAKEVRFHVHKTDVVMLTNEAKDIALFSPQGANYDVDFIISLTLREIKKGRWSLWYFE